MRLRFPSNSVDCYYYDFLFVQKLWLFFFAVLIQFQCGFRMEGGVGQWRTLGLCLTGGKKAERVGWKCGSSDLSSTR